MSVFCAVCVLVVYPQFAFSDVWKEPKTGIEFVSIPAGTYTQGCGKWASDCNPDESPVRTVKLDAFWIGRTEVTQGQWKRVMGTNPAGFPRGDNFPVENVSRQNVNDFLEKLAALVPEEKFRLPTEAEWEYACRAEGQPLSYGTKDGSL
ncbi:MAG: formylglycine-generating enzyme family protein, partial [Gammaproteobacteria bacterium]|nr:formylglycine-generating enzyme family protein [Gammaproteobacteria bacterium]